MQGGTHGGFVPSPEKQAIYIPASLAVGHPGDQKFTVHIVGAQLRLIDPNTVEYEGRDLDAVPYRGLIMKLDAVDVFVGRSMDL